ncbi:MAG: pilus assembly protein [Coriobacteriia bacterium]|nr:pilus assembly protein [Coriobacteriia bacterium]
MCGGLFIARHRDDGAAAVEFALVAMLFFTLLFGAIQFGYTFFEYVSVAHAAREGVRWAALGASGETVELRAVAAAPGLDPDRITLSIDNPASDSVRVRITYVRTQLVPIPDVVLPASISSAAVQRLE